MDKAEIILLDGGMGTMLQAAGLPLGELPELWNVTQPETVSAVQRRYAGAGSKVLYTNTFGANRYKAAGCGYGVGELVRWTSARRGACSSRWATFRLRRPTTSSARSSPPALRPGRISL